MREEPGEVMADEVEFSNQAAGVSDIQNFFSKILVFDAISKTSVKECFFDKFDILHPFGGAGRPT